MNYFESVVGSIIAAIAAGITWLIRTVLTNKQQIALLTKEIQERDKRRDEDRQFLSEFRTEFKVEMKEVKDDLDEVRSELLEVWKTK